MGAVETGGTLLATLLGAAHEAGFLVQQIGRLILQRKLISHFGKGCSFAGGVSNVIPVQKIRHSHGGEDGGNNSGNSGLEM